MYRRAAYTVDVGHQRDFRDYCCRALLQIGQGGWVSFLSFIAVL